MAEENNYFLGKLAVERKLITAEELQAAVDEQSRNPGTPLSEILLAMEFIGQKEISVLRRELQKTDGPTLENAPAGNIPSGEVEKTRLVCGSCKTEFLLAGYNPAKTYNCSKCKGTLAPKVEAKKAGVSGPIIDTRFPPDLKPELRSKARSFGKYILIDELGRGGMGVVYRAWEHAAKRYVAVKCMLKADDPTEVKRFQREARTSSGLQHENIVGVYDVGEQDETMYIAMEYVDGKPFSRHLNPRNPADKRMGLKEALAIIRDSAKALDCAHEAGIVHRDVKPQNVMVGKAGEAKVMDFGLAREMKRGATVTTEGTVMGTPYYMSPEQTRGKPEFVDHRTDIWALGVMIYEVSTKELPFDADRPVEILHLINTTEPVPPRRKNPRMDVDLETITMKCLERDPERRYKTSSELADDLDRYLRKKPIQARPASAFYKLRKRLAKRKGVVWASSAGLVVVAAVLAFLIPKLGSARKQATEAGAAAESARQATLEQLKQTTETALAAALGFRQMGRIEEMRRFLKQTEDACRKAAKEIPDAPEPHYRLGRMHRAMMSNEEALSEQNKALKSDSEFAPARYERAILSARKYHDVVQSLIQKSQRRRGARLAEMPMSPESLQPVAPGELAAQDPEAVTLKEALLADLNHLAKAPARIGQTEMECVRGLLDWTTGRLDAARNSLEGVVSKGSVHLEEALETLAELERQARRFDKSIHWWSLGIEKDRGYVPFHEGRARAHASWGLDKWHRGEDPSPMYSSALDDYSIALRLDSSRDQAWLNCGVTEADWGAVLQHRGEDAGGHFKAAISNYDEALRRNPARDLGWNYRGLCRGTWADLLKAQGKEFQNLVQLAIEDYTEALKLNSESAENWAGRGLARIRIILARKGSSDLQSLTADAMSDFAEATHRNPDYGVAWEMLGMLHLGLAEEAWRRREDASPLYEKVIKHCTEAIRCDPRSFAGLLNRGMARSRWVAIKATTENLRKDSMRESIKEAFVGGLADLDGAIAIDPKDPFARITRGNLRYHHARFRKTLDKATEIKSEIEEAVTDFEVALKRVPELEPSFHDSLDECRRYLQSLK